MNYSQMRRQNQTIAVVILLALLLLLTALVPLWLALGFAVAATAYRVSIAGREQRPKEISLEPRSDGVMLGRDVNTGEPVFVSDRQLAAHSVILGATGAGKTTTLLTIISDAIARGLRVVAIDLKGADSFGRALDQATHAAGRRFQFWTFNGPMCWNPLAYGDATELKDKLISTERFTEPHYQRAAERYLQLAIGVLKQTRPDKPVTLSAVVSLLDPARLQQALRYAPQELVNQVGPYVSSLNRDQKSAVSGLQSRLAVIAESAPGQWLQPLDGRPQLDLRHALSGGDEVVLFSLNSSRYGKLAAQIAALIIQDLVTISSHRQALAGQPQALIAIDEFSALDADNILSLLARARAAGMSVLLATQEMTDLERLAPGFRDQALGIVGSVIAHRQSVPDSAEFLAKMIGTNTVTQHTWQTGPPATVGAIVGQAFGKRPGPQKTGMGTMKEVEEFRIHPNLIKDLPVGRAVLITKTPSADARIVDVIAAPASHASHEH